MMLRMGMTRRRFLWSLAAVAGVGALWWKRDWVPVRGVLNPCHPPSLPEPIASHPAVVDAMDGLDLSKVWDCHVHLVGTGDQAPGDIWVNPVMDSPWHPLQAVQKRLYMNASCVPDSREADLAYVGRLRELVESTPGIRLLLLAFDYNYDESGRRRPELSTFFVSDRYAQRVALRHAQFEWICSVHPYRADAVEALHWAAEHGARAVKWLPPAMGMDPSSARCDPFYEAMRDLDLPLLTHGGHELAAEGGGRQDLGNPELLRRPLEHGVRVIVAHCASLGAARIYADGRSAARTKPRNFGVFLDMMRDPGYEGLLFGDISAITQINRAPEALKTLLLSQDIHHRLLNGSDYPLTGILPLFSLSQLVRLGLIDAEIAPVLFEVQKLNPLLFDLLLKRNLQWQGHKFPNAVFETAGFFRGHPGSPG